MQEKNQYRVCVSVGRPDMESAIQAAQKIADLADVIEIRLDSIAGAAIRPFVQAISCPLLFTNRPTWEGGFFTGSEMERVELLIEAIRQGTAYIDLELQSPSESLLRVQGAIAHSDSQLILSHHDFKRTPSRNELVEILQSMQEKGADIGKIITTAHDYHDVLRILHLQEDASAIQFPLIAFCMGRAGVISRFATLELGGFMTYCAVDADEATAPGQASVHDLRAFLRLLDDGLNRRGL